MSGRRPWNGPPLRPDEKAAVLEEYWRHYQAIASRDPDVLNRKIPRQAFAAVLDEIAEIVWSWAGEFAEHPGPVRKLLDSDPLPPLMKDRLPDRFRAYCLLLNALKQWTAAEQAATDRYLLGGRARALCRKLTSVCLITGEPLDGRVELHHTVRDGRPPIPVSPRGHALLEQQETHEQADPLSAALTALRRRRGGSWASLRRGCLDLLGRGEPSGSPATGANAKAFARAAVRATGADPADILVWLDEPRVQRFAARAGSAR